MVFFFPQNPSLSALHHLLYIYIQFGYFVGKGKPVLTSYYSTSTLESLIVLINYKDLCLITRVYNIIFLFHLTLLVRCTRFTNISLIPISTRTLETFSCTNDLIYIYSLLILIFYFVIIYIWDVVVFVP